MSLPDRFWAKVLELPNGCWKWTGARSGNGYGSWRLKGAKESLVHRWTYDEFIGEIPPELVLDHLCHDRRKCEGGPTCPHRLCCNPWHLDPVPHSVNHQRGCKDSAHITHCPRGHEYAGHNLYVNPRNERQCRACLNAYKRRVRRPDPRRNRRAREKAASSN